MTVERRTHKEVWTPGWWLERDLWLRGYSPVAGVDEAGRGALAGPVVAAAVILPHGTFAYDDSKKLSAVVRAALAEDIKLKALAWAVGMASAQEVDTLNVLWATHLAARRAVAQLELRPAALVTDYLKLAVSYPVTAVPKADARSFQVAAASILAKTTRDALMAEYAHDYPHYGFEGHKGYSAPRHLAALSQHGPCDLHRRSFRPVAQAPLFGAAVD